MPVASPEITWEQIRERMDQSVTERGEWAGAPMPIDGLKLVVEPRYPYQGLNGMAFGEKSAAEVLAESLLEVADFKVRNMWRSSRHQAVVVVMEEADGRITKCFLADGAGTRVDFLVNTLGVAASAAWSLEAESKAQEKLKSLVSPHAFKCYQLSGMFLETSQRSRATYLFRKLRPTLALRGEDGDRTKVVAALCLHPIGYYENSFAGVMVPTDCVISHLLLMRADEHRYWRFANQHRLGTSQAGV